MSSREAPPFPLYECPVCMGLGNFEKQTRPDREPSGFVAVHSTSLKLDDVIRLLPEGKEQHD
jgi:hypothetical protein